MIQASVLIVSDDSDFARAVATRWQSQRHSPEITLATSDLWLASSGTGYDLVVVSPVGAGKLAAILSSLDASPSTAAVCLLEDETGDPGVARLARLTHALVVFKKDGWLEALILLSSEALRRVDALGRAQRAERVALESQRQAALGRYMLEMRPGINNALTSVIGNADLLLLGPEQLSPESHEQIRTIHAMALRLNEVMQRFSSLAAEMRAGE